MPRPDDQRALEGLAARAVALIELGRTDAEVVADLASYLARFDMRTAEAVRGVAAAIGRLPRPAEQPVDEQERSRPKEQMLGVPSAEEELEAMRRARAVLQEYATYLEQQG
jgi:hypothetical protein